MRVEFEAHAAPRETDSQQPPPQGGSSPGAEAGEMASPGPVDGALFGELADAAHDAIMWIDPGGRIQTFNTAACRMFGYGPEETVGRSTSMLVPDAQASAQDACSTAHSSR